METAPSFSDLLIPTVQVLKAKGGKATNAEIIEGLLHRGFSHGHNHASSKRSDKRSELEYRAAWARSYLKAFGALANPSRGLWTISGKADEVTEDNLSSIVNSVVAEAARKSRELKKAKKIRNTDAVRKNVRQMRSIEKAPDVTSVDQAKMILGLLDSGLLDKETANSALKKLYSGGAR